MPIAYFPLTVDVSQIVGTPVKRARLMVATNLTPGTPIAYGALGKIAVPGGIYEMYGGVGELSFPTKAGATNVSTWQYVITGEYTVDGVRPIALDPIYIDAPATTAALNLASFIGVTSAPPSYIGAAIDAINAAGSAAIAPAVAAKDAAIVAKDQAVAAKVAVEGILITDLATTDGQSSALIETPSSLTRTSLDNAIADGVEASPVIARRGATATSEFAPPLGLAPTLESSNFIPMLVLDNGTMYGRVSTSFQLAKSVDGGTSYTLTTAPDGNWGITRMWRTPSGALLVVTATQKVFRTTNEGATWALSWSPTAGIDEAILDNGVVIWGGDLYAGIYCGTNHVDHEPRVLKSTDDGVTWTTIHTFKTIMAGESGTNTIRHLHGMHSSAAGLWAICGDPGETSGMFKWEGGAFVKKSPNLPNGIEASRWVALSVEYRDGYFYWAEDSNGDRIGGIYRAPVAELSDHSKLELLAVIPTSGWYTAKTPDGTIIIGGALETGPIDDGVLRVWAVDLEGRVHEIFSAPNHPNDTAPKNVVTNVGANAAGDIWFVVHTPEWMDWNSYYRYTGFVGKVRPGQGHHPRKGASALYGGGPTGLAFPATMDPTTVSAAGLSEWANVTYFMRNVGAPMTISKIGLIVGDSIGNIQVSVYSGNGLGRAARPSKRKATSGSVACPAAGYREVALPSSVTVEAGDWLALSTDSNFASFGKVAALDATQNAGRATYQLLFAPPTDPVTSAWSKHGFLLVGVP